MKLKRQMLKYNSVFFFMLFTASLSLSGQKISVGALLYVNQTNFEAGSSSSADFNGNIINLRPMLGIIYDWSAKLFSEHSLSFYDQINESKLLGDYSYHYSFLTFQNNLLYRFSSGFYLGGGLPLNYTTKAIQANKRGSINLRMEQNVPNILFGYNFKIGYSHAISEKWKLFYDFTYSDYLNSLDKDQGQKLKARNYVFAIKIAVDL